MNDRIAWVRPATDEVPGEGIDRRRTMLEPHVSEHDPLILWGEDWFRRGAFDWHPHRGFETVSYVLEGEMELADSTGAKGRLGPGDVQWTTAGSGFFHDGQPVGDTVTHGMQLWLNLPASKRMSPPNEQVVRGDEAATFGDAAFRGRVFGGTCNGVTGAAELLHPATFVELRFDQGALALDIAAEQAGALYCLEGTLRVNGHLVPEGHGARIEPGTEPIQLEAVDPGVALIATGEPINEPCVIDGPFVMNTKAEIAQAYADMEAGLMGTPLRTSVSLAPL